MAQYSKTYSNYTLKERHQDVNEGTILERDWGTLGERHVIETGKRKYDTDSNFVFTDNIIVGPKKRNDSGEWSEAITESQLSNVDATVNDISILSKSDDIRNYAYFGSASELVKASIENILKWYPGRFYSDMNSVAKNVGGDYYIKSIDDDGYHNYVIIYSSDESDGNYYLVENPFNINFYRSSQQFDTYDNTLRNMPYSWRQYVMNGASLLSWNVWINKYDPCDKDNTVEYDITFEYYEMDCSISFSVEMSECDEGGGGGGDTPTGEDCITFQVEGEDRPAHREETRHTGHIYGLKKGKDIVWYTNVPEMIIQPNSGIIEEYYKNLSPFEALLLNRKTKPLYTATFITPVKYSEVSDYGYGPVAYTWPSQGNSIVVDGIGFNRYVESLYSMALLMDELWCDNIWRNMTHETIKTFDYSYDGGDEEAVLGITRMQHIIRVIGRTFDDLKQYIDNISLKNTVEFDGYNSIAPAEVSDKCELSGWEVYSTKMNVSENINLTSEGLAPIRKQSNRFDGLSSPKWFNTLNPDYLTQNDVDNNFMRKLLLNTGSLLKAKGTKKSIEMMLGMFGFGDKDFSITERYYSVTPVKSDDKVYYYKQNLTPDTASFTYIRIGTPTISEYLVNHGCVIDSSFPQNIVVGGEYFDLMNDKTFKELAVELNEKKKDLLNYKSDVFSGVPLKEINIGGDNYIVPYFTQDKIYDGDVQFETKGGWSKSISSGMTLDDASKILYDYQETLPYMEIVQNCSALTNINYFDVKGKKIYYVMDLTDLSEFCTTIPPRVSHLFKLDNPDNPSAFSSWKNVPLWDENDTEATYNTYCLGYDLCQGVDYEDYKLAQYCDSIRLVSEGNNPHTGNGLYDLGSEYKAYLTMPFKYSIENYGYNDKPTENLARQILFEIKEYEGDKIVNRVNSDSIEYIIPSKAVVIKNNLKMSDDAKKMFSDYFYNIILKYLTQIIPSTMIFILKDF